MKKNLLTLGLLGLAFQGFGQYAPRFQEVNTIATSVTPPDYVVEYVNTVSPSVMWATVYDRNATTTSTASGVRALPASGSTVAGTEFDYFPIASRNNPTFLTSNIAGIDANTAIASTFNSGSAGGGEVVRTTDGGLTWARATTAAQFAAPAGFNNFVHMFNATDGVAFGDPNGAGYEILTTADGGATWTRNTSAGLVPTISGEYGLTRAFTAYGNTIWAAGGVQANSTAGTPGGISRMFKNTNKGLGAWTAVTLPAAFTGPATDIVFRDANNGMAMNVVVTGTAITGINRAFTTDGGATWTVNNLSAPIIGTGGSTPGSGSFYFTGIDATQGKFISYGRRKFTGNALADFGYSYSTDGMNWTDVQTNCPFTALDLLDADGQGFGGYVTLATDGSGGIIKTTNLPGATGWQYALGTRNTNAALQQALSVYPNPSADGNFTLKLNSGVKAGTQVRVIDVMGRQVYSRELNATAVNSQTAVIDLSAQKSGVYTLELRSAEGTAQQKLVVQ